MKTTEIEFTKINHDVNGNPRYVCHFLNILTDAEEKQAHDEAQNIRDASNGTKWVSGVDIAYEMAIKKAKAIGGKRYHNKNYGGGIVFQSYNINQTKQDILNLRNP